MAGDPTIWRLSPEVLDSWRPGDSERAAAWELYVELAILAPVIQASARDGSLSDALDALDRLVARTKAILQRHGPALACRRDRAEEVATATSFADIALAVLDVLVRPLLETWKPRLAAHEARQPPAVVISLPGERELWPGLSELRSALSELRSPLDAYQEYLCHHGSFVSPLRVEGSHPAPPPSRLKPWTVHAVKSVHAGIRTRWPPPTARKRLLEPLHEWKRTAFRSNRWFVGRCQDYLLPLPTKPQEDDEPPTKTKLEDGIPRGMTADMAQAVLEEARAIYAARDARLERINARATMLQSAVGIATSLLVAAMALLLDPNRITKDNWRAGLALVLGLLVFCLGMTGWMAARTTLQGFVRARPRSRNIVRRFKEEDDADRAAHLRAQAIDLIDAANDNAETDRRRTAMLECARRWYRWALLATFLLAALLVTYACVAQATKPPSAPSCSVTTTP